MSETPPKITSKIEYLFMKKIQKVNPGNVKIKLKESINIQRKTNYLNNPKANICKSM